MTAAEPQDSITVNRIELVEALERHTKMKRAPNGVRSTGLREAAFIPAIAGFRVEMPGGAHFVWAVSGQLSNTVCFSPKFTEGLLKVLKIRSAEVATVSVTNDQIEFRCEGSKVTIPILSPQSKKPRSK